MIQGKHLSIINSSLCDQHIIIHYGGSEAISAARSFIKQSPMIEYSLNNTSLLKQTYSQLASLFALIGSLSITTVKDRP